MDQFERYLLFDLGFAWELLPILASTEGELGGVTSTSWRSEYGEEEDDPAGDPGMRWGDPGRCWGDPAEGGGSAPGLGFRLAGGGLGSGSDPLDMHSITLPRQAPSLSNGFDPTAAPEPLEGFSELFRMLRGRDGLVFKSPVEIPRLFSSPSSPDSVF